MATKIVLTKTPDQVRAEEEAKERERIKEVAANQKQRQEKLYALYRKDKQRKLIIYAVIVSILLIFIVWGTWGAFFKKGISMDEVNKAIAQSQTKLNFPAEGLDNYLQENCTELIQKYITSTQEVSVKDVIVDKNSCAIIKVQRLGTQWAEVYFGVDVSVKSKSVTVTNADLITELTEKFGLSLETPVVSYGYGDGNVVFTYRMMEDGTIVKDGDFTTERYNFILPVNRNYEYDGNELVRTRYIPSGPLTLYTLTDTDNVEITTADIYKFEGVLVDDDTLSRMKIKVDKILKDLYEHKDTSQDFFNYRAFNTYGAEYKGIKELKVYTKDNYFGYNARIVYTIKTQQGFQYDVETYLKIEPNGTSFIITNIK